MITIPFIITRNISINNNNNVILNSSAINFNRLKGHKICSYQV